MAQATEVTYRNDLVRRLRLVPVLVIPLITIIDQLWWSMMLALVALIALSEIALLARTRYRDPKQLAALSLMAALVLCGLAAAHVLRLDSPNGVIYIVVALAGCIATDAFAYFGGKTYGTKGTFFPRISPNKSREGAFIGVVWGSALGMATASVGVMAFGVDIDFAALWVMAATLPLVSTSGDLIASGIKRIIRVKDCSQLISGHGGLNDRLDSLVVSAVWAASFHAYGVSWQLIAVPVILGLFYENAEEVTTGRR